MPFKHGETKEIPMLVETSKSIARTVSTAKKWLKKSSPIAEVQEEKPSN